MQFGSRGKHLGGIWEASVGGVCGASEIWEHLGSIWEASDETSREHLGGIWKASGRHLGLQESMRLQEVLETIIAVPLNKNAKVPLKCKFTMCF